MAKSTVKTATGNVFGSNEKGHKIVAIHLAGGADSATAKIYDDGDGTDNQKASLAATAGSNDRFEPNEPIDVDENIRVVLTGTGPECTVVYD